MTELTTSLVLQEQTYTNQTYKNYQMIRSRDSRTAWRP